MIRETPCGRRMVIVVCVFMGVAAIQTIARSRASESRVPQGSRVKRAAANRPVRKLPHQPTYSNEQLVNGIESNDMVVRGRTIVDWRSNHEQLVTELIRIAKSNRDEREFRSPQELAITMLGELRCHEAIPVLLEKIDDHYPMPIMNEHDAYPCFIALRNIGPSCVRPMLTRVGGATVEEISEKAIELYAWLLFEFYAFDPPGPQEAVAVVKRYMALPFVRNRGPKNSANLQRLAEKVAELSEGRRKE